MTFDNNNQQQSYLALAYTLIRNELLPEAPERRFVVISYGFPKGGRGTVGQCWQGKDPDLRSVIFIHPRLFNGAVDVLECLAHEMIHAALPEAHHGKAFGKVARRMGLEGPLTATHAGETLKQRLNNIANALPPFPAAQFNPNALVGPKKQGTRLRLYLCACGVKVRVASDEFDATCNICKTQFEKQ